MAPAALVGVCLGLAFGLEQSSAFYAVAGCAAFLLLPGPFWRRFGLSFVFGLGVLAGLAADSCVMFTAHDAYLRKYALRIPGDCVASERDSYRRAALAYLARMLKADVTAATRQRMA